MVAQKKMSGSLPWHDHRPSRFRWEEVQAAAARGGCVVRQARHGEVPVHPLQEKGERVHGGAGRVRGGSRMACKGVVRVKKTGGWRGKTTGWIPASWWADPPPPIPLGGWGRGREKRPGSI